MVRPPSIDWFPVWLGLYAAVLSLAVTWVAVGGFTAISLGVAVVVWIVATVLADAVDGLAVAISRRRVHLLLLFAPLLVLPGFLVESWLGPPPSFLPWPALGLALLVPGLGVFVTADNQRVEEVTRGDRPRLAWVAAPGDRFARRWKRVFLALGIAFVVGPFALLLLSDWDVIGTTAIGGGLLGQYHYLGRKQEYAAYDAGLVIEPRGSLRAVIVPWHRFTGYRVTDEELIVVRRLPGTSLHCALADLEDPDAVTSALDAHLDRLD
ncbi:MAG: hypothetical protein ABEJ31_10815 [Haloarculaceae archaeon]